MPYTTILSTRHQRAGTWSNWPAKVLLNELQGSSMLQPQQVTAFPAEHTFTIVRDGLRPNADYRFYNESNQKAIRDRSSKVETLLSTTSVCARVWRRSSPSLVALIQVSS
jgi:hypothetical protein